MPNSFVPTGTSAGSSTTSGAKVGALLSFLVGGQGIPLEEFLTIDAIDWF